MPSVENFYWILYENLLKPSLINCFYFYPWGTTHTISRGEYHPIYRWQHFYHVLFHFDQEPLWSNNLGYEYDRNEDAWPLRYLRVLANSEHSDLKKQILRDRQMLDWYYFYHGFAALDWYRDTKYINTDLGFDTAFLSLNHIINGQRSYRLDLISRLIEQDVHRNGKISLHANQQDIENELNNPWTKLTPMSQKRIADVLCADINLPWSVDHLVVDGNLSAHCGFGEYKLWQSALFHVVSETVFYEPKLHLTEKIFKPIVSMRPFILVGAPGNLEYLRSYGFETFDRWIDESYDKILDPGLRLESITNELVKVSQLSPNQLADMHHEMKPLLEHNKQHFFTTFREHIVDELLENFETCIRVWNHARIDDHVVPVPNNLDLVRNVLLGRSA